MLINASEMRVAGVPIGFTHGRKLPTAGLNFSAVLTFLVIICALVNTING